ncbi:DUF4142 domain-containing protein [Chryseobacterium terrae]|uniref:DUF4142 domain-containing protein n=1 Tax=Chryseobacterium terrae TaxID=3163299 RepID=A0ABW8Y304_9FLAO
MKNSILIAIALTSLVACNKNKTTNVDTTTDTMSTSAPVDSGMMPRDSTTMPNATSAATLSDQDKKFADAAAMGGMMEVTLGEMASKTGTNSSVKSLGMMMAKDHSKANEELKSWASANGYTLPASLDAEKQKMVDNLKAKKGADFDKAYADMMVKDHKKDIEEFKKQASQGSDASLKSFASKTLPTLEHHLMESEKTKTALK